MLYGDKLARFGSVEVVGTMGPIGKINRSHNKV